MRLESFIARTRAWRSPKRPAGSRKGIIYLSKRTESQAASLEETATSIEKRASTVAKNANNATEGTHAAMKACDDATQGGDAINDKKLG